MITNVIKFILSDFEDAREMGWGDAAQAKNGDAEEAQGQGS